MCVIFKRSDYAIEVSTKSKVMQVLKVCKLANKLIIIQDVIIPDFIFNIVQFLSN